MNEYATLNAAGIYVLFKTISADEIKIKSLLQETFDEYRML